MEHGTFLGWIGDDVLHLLYRIADVCVVPSIYEPFGLVALEAMASGCPCIVADTGGLREVVPHGEVGLRFRTRDPEALGGMVERVLTEPELTERLVAEASEHVLRFDWNDVAARTAEVYAELWPAPGLERWRASLDCLAILTRCVPRINRRPRHDADRRSSRLLLGGPHRRAARPVQQCQRVSELEREPLGMPLRRRRADEEATSRAILEEDRDLVTTESVGRARVWLQYWVSTRDTRATARSSSILPPRWRWTLVQPRLGLGDR